MPITDLHLINFINKLDAIRENLHLRTLTAREIKEILFNGFSTTEPGVGGNYNVVYQGFRSKKLSAPWRNTKGKNYRTERFEFNYGHHLTVICDKERSTKFRLPIVKDFHFIKLNPINVLYNMTSKGFTSLSVIKQCYAPKIIKKLHILLENSGNYTQTLNINTELETDVSSPLSVRTWVKTKILSKLGVKLTTEGKINTRVSDGSYLYNDVGSISDIEMIDLIQDVEQINAIRY